MWVVFQSAPHHSEGYRRMHQENELGGNVYIRLTYECHIQGEKWNTQGTHKAFLRDEIWNLRWAGPNVCSQSQRLPGSPDKFGILLFLWVVRTDRTIWRSVGYPRKFWCQTHDLQDSPSLLPDHDSSTNLSETSWCFIHIDLYIVVFGQRDS